MEMRSPRLTAKRYYHPWDPLQLSDEIDSGARVRRNSVNFELFRTFRRKVMWTALAHKNAVFFLDEPSESISYVRLLLEQAKKDPIGSVTLAWYAFNDDYEEELLQVDDENPEFTYHPYSDSIEHFLTSLIEHRAEIRRKTAEEGLLEAPNKMNQIILFQVGEKELEDLRSPVRLKMFKSLLEDSGNSRIYLFPFFGDAREVPRTLFKSLDQYFFVGDNNSEFARNELYPDWEVTANSFAQLLIGYGVSSPEEKLVSLHHRKFVESSWSVKNRESIKTEENLYREYLESLRKELDEEDD